MLDWTLLGTRKLYTIAISSRVKNDYWYSRNNNITYKLLTFLELLKLVLHSRILMVATRGVMSYYLGIHNFENCVLSCVYYIYIYI